MEWLVMGICFSPETQRKLVIKIIHDNIHCDVAATQKRIKLQAWWPVYSRDVGEYVKICKKCRIRIKKITQTTLHSWPREVEPWSRVYTDHAYITGVGLLLILVLSFRMAWSNSCARQVNFYDKTDFKVPIFQKQHTKNPGIRQCTRILWWRS